MSQPENPLSAMSEQPHVDSVPVPTVTAPSGIVALVGRPNVGKSSIFNRLLGQRQAVVEDVPGTTRDRVYGVVEWQDHVFTVTDTGGIAEERDVLADFVYEQVQAAIEEATVIVFVLDTPDGITPQDEEIAALLRNTKKPIVIAANKADNHDTHLQTFEFYSLGFGEIVSLSALHGLGTGDLLDAICAHLPQDKSTQADVTLPQFAIVGRPNVGKSALLNALLGHERTIVSDVPGTTRDAIDTEVTYGDDTAVLIDTAGIRRRGKVQHGVESHSVLRTLRALERCNVALLVIDAAEGLTAQDLHIAGYVNEAYKGLVVLINKWDLVDEDAGDVKRIVQGRMRWMPHAPAVVLSAKTGYHLSHILPSALQVFAERGRRIPTGLLNRTLRGWLANRTLSSRRRRLSIYYVTQASTHPPTFIFSVNNPELAHFSHRRFLENNIRRHFGFDGTPIRLLFHDHHG
jgi:GTP-binding protein